MNEIFLLKQGEMVLKGLNKRGFEEKLMGNAKRRLKAFGSFKVYTRQSTTYVEPLSEDCDIEGAWEAMVRLFGIVGLSRAYPCEKDKDAIVAACDQMDASQLYESGHALKGVYANLGLDALAGMASTITEEFRPGNARTMDDGEVKAKLDEIAALYKLTAKGIREYEGA